MVLNLLLRFFIPTKIVSLVEMVMKGFMAKTFIGHKVGKTFVVIFGVRQSYYLSAFNLALHETIRRWN